MGLDMYLTKKIYIRAEYEHRKITGEINILRDGEKIPVNFSRVSYIEETAGYWRKANAIHAWFVANVQDGTDDCENYYVSNDDMKKLLAVVKAIKADHSKAPKLLPTQSGFFFGGTEYDEYYFHDLDATERIIENCISAPEGEYYYRSSW